MYIPCITAGVGTAWDIIQTEEAMVVEWAQLEDTEEYREVMDNNHNHMTYTTPQLNVGVEWIKGRHLRG